MTPSASVATLPDSHGPPKTDKTNVKAALLGQPFCNVLGAMLAAAPWPETSDDGQSETSRCGVLTLPRQQRGLLAFGEGHFR